MKNYKLEVEFCKKALRHYLVEGRYKEGADTIKLLEAKNPKQAKELFLKECYALMREMFNGSSSPKPREALNLIDGVAEHIPKEWKNSLVEKYAHHMTHDLLKVEIIL